jgi:hypothetical protein
MNPLKNTEGMMKIMLICSACIWVSAPGGDQQAEAEQARTRTRHASPPSAPGNRAGDGHVEQPVA